MASLLDILFLINTVALEISCDCAFTFRSSAWNIELVNSLSKYDTVLLINESIVFFVLLLDGWHSLLISLFGQDFFMAYFLLSSYFVRTDLNATMRGVLMLIISDFRSFDNIWSKITRLESIES